MQQQKRKQLLFAQYIFTSVSFISNVSPGSNKLIQWKLLKRVPTGFTKPAECIPPPISPHTTINIPNWLIHLKASEKPGFNKIIILMILDLKKSRR